MNSIKRLQIYLDKEGILGWTAPREDVQEVLNQLRFNQELIKNYQKTVWLQDLLLRINEARHVRD